MWNVFSARCIGLLTVAVSACVIATATAQSPPVGAPTDLIGSWRGDAVLNGDATPAMVEFLRCEEGVCARLSLPELDTEGLPLGAVTEDSEGRLNAGLITFNRSGRQLTGDLRGAGGGMFLAAMGHGGGPAAVSVTRSRAPEPTTREENVAFQNGDVTLSGTLVKPLHGAGRFPAIVAVLGSGPAPRWFSLSRARAWAQLGYATLIYDKRSNWPTSSLDDLADDVVAATRYLRTRNDIRADRIGVWAHSQGGWVAPHAIARGADAAFLIAVSGGGATPTQVERYGYGGSLVHMEVQGADLARANAVIDRYLSYLAGDIPLATLTASYDEVRSTRWFAALGIERVTPSETDRAQWRWVATYDPAEDVARLSTPTLVMLAGGDHNTPMRDSVQGWTSAFIRSGLSDARILVYPNADHHMNVANGGGWRRSSAEYQAELTRFLVQQRDR